MKRNKKDRRNYNRRQRRTFIPVERFAQTFDWANIQLNNPSKFERNYRQISPSHVARLRRLIPENSFTKNYMFEFTIIWWIEEAKSWCKENNIPYKLVQQVQLQDNWHGCYIFTFDTAADLMYFSLNFI